MSFKNRWVEPTSQNGRKLYRQLRQELRSSRTTKARRADLVALLDILAKSPDDPKHGLTDEVRDLYTRMTGAEGEAAMRFFHSLSTQQRQGIRSSVDVINDGDFGTWFTVQYWLKQHGQPNALDGGKHGEPTLA